MQAIYFSVGTRGSHEVGWEGAVRFGVSAVASVTCFPCVAVEGNVEGFAENGKAHILPLRDVF